jgi:Uma2 family endonuclease
MALPVAQRRFTWEEVLRMAQAGILHEDDRLELVRGHLVEMPPIGERHAHLVARIDHVLRRGLGDRAVFQVQNPLWLTRYTVVQPDIMVLRPRADLYPHYPRPADAFLVVEVADATLAYDRGLKARLYARHGVPELWVADVPGDRVEVHRARGATRYRAVQAFVRGQRVAPLAFPDTSFDVADLLGEPS